ncbi:MAG TPA: MBL fold metallo-hydrolase [Rhabdaerophilum sp.]|nr:MBL fold metallo-hydrolase [Rhabdaerophilum sp.]
MNLSRRNALSAIAAMSGGGFFGLPAFAKAPLANVQAVGLSRIKIGSIEVTAISDGFLDIALALFKGADEARINALLASSFRSAGPHRSSVNAYVVNTGDKLAIIDSGTITGFAPTLARFLAGFTAAGFDVNAVDIILATHLHPDHVGGIFNATGAVFPNAVLAVHEREHAFWTDAGIASRAPKEFQPFFKIAQDALKPYAARTQRFKGGEEIIPGVNAVELFGHTPGHSGFRISSGSQQLLIWGDIVHAPALQFASPEITIGFDSDQNQARETRLKVLDSVATDKVLVTGAHLDFPGYGNVVKAATGYAFHPVPFGYGL